MAAPPPPLADHNENGSIERFRRDIVATGRALSHNAELDLQFLANSAPPQHHTLRMQRPQWPLQRLQVGQIRGEMDAAALRILNHDPAIHDCFHWQDSDAQRLFEALEQTRCEALGARYMLGAQANLGEALEHKLQQQGIHTTACDKVPLPAVMQLLACDALYGCRPPSAVAVISHWHPQIEHQIGDLLTQLRQEINDQAGFAKLALQMLERLGFMMDVPADDDPLFARQSSIKR